MIHILVFAPDAESGMLKDLIADIGARYNSAECEFYTFRALAQMLEWMDKTDWIDVFFCDVTREGSIGAVRTARRKYPKMLFIPIADASVLPSAYVQPDTMPYGLLWRPLTPRSCQTLVQKALLEAADAGDGARKDESVFTAKTRMKVYQIPYQSILFFESKNKRIRLRTQNSEIQFYHTLAKLEAEVPVFFFRCHHSYLVNGNHILAVDWTAMSVLMREEITIPFSRHYRAVVKERMNGNRPH